MIVRTEKSWNPPHRVTFKGHDKFYSRSTNGKYALDVEELRNIFNLSATTAERIRNFRIDRINKILADDTPIPLLSLPRTVLHIVPLISINPGQVYDITYVYRFPDKLPTVQKLMDDRRYNVDGIITFSMEIKGRYYAYTQLFKNGIIESTNASLLEPSKAGLSIPGGLFESKLIQSFSAYLSLMKESPIELPAYVFLSVLGVRGYKMETSERRTFQVFLIDRDHLILPETIVSNYDAKAKDILRPCFDSVWNACGYSRCLFYDKDGNLKG